MTKEQNTELINLLFNRLQCFTGYAIDDIIGYIPGQLKKAMHEYVSEGLRRLCYPEVSMTRELEGIVIVCKDIETDFNAEFVIKLYRSAFADDQEIELLKRVRSRISKNIPD